MSRQRQITRKTGRKRVIEIKTEREKERQRQTDRQTDREER